MNFTIAKNEDISAIMNLYEQVINHVNTTNIKLGWNIDIYPNKAFVEAAVIAGECLIAREDNTVLACSVVNNIVNDEYSLINWQIKEPSTQIATIHALCVSPEYRGKTLSYDFLNYNEQICKERGNLAIHLDVIDSNISAFKLYSKNKYKLIKEIEMYYEVVGTRKFSMFEKIL